MISRRLRARALSSKEREQEFYAMGKTGGKTLKTEELWQIEGFTSRTNTNTGGKKREAQASLELVMILRRVV